MSHVGLQFGRRLLVALEVGQVRVDILGDLSECMGILIREFEVEVR
jgi:hypothetical protein